MSNITVIDATNTILGRLSSTVAKRLLKGEKIMIINAEKVVISGRKRSIIDHYKEKANIRTLTAPWKGPFHYRRPDRIVRRTIRGMLPFKKPKGREAYRNLIVHIGIPEDIKEESITRIDKIDASRLRGKYITIKELSKELGWSYKEEI
ncbi:MAG: 50S ribosomal protein L13 [Candidatus Odinarchaeia archaeon]